MNIYNLLKYKCKELLTWHLHGIESLHPPGHPTIATVLRDIIKETFGIGSFIISICTN
jgi:hypothetical protein